MLSIKCKDDYEICSLVNKARHYGLKVTSITAKCDGFILFYDGPVIIRKADNKYDIYQLLETNNEEKLVESVQSY